ncbi:efflux RND transporter periplasmic adaptor subunit [Fodinicurvata halophila]|uniref:efflux RND transporter periplasmic adaptor subunit n=1 Tax=Fodinicurvata halophila TaxID=1419723 RepID=UPI00362C2EBE
MRTSAEYKTSSAAILRGLAAASLLALLAACGSEDSAQGQAGGQGGGPPPQVNVVTTERQDRDVYADYAGRARGAREVEVRARVEGILQKRLYDEGKVVEEDDSLFAIDPEPFALALQAARAERDRAEAEVQQAEREWRRVSRLYEQNAISERERDAALSTLELARASLALSTAQVDQARLELDYTDVAAPAPGVTSLEALPEGSLVERGSLLTTITQMDPVHVRFALPESDAALQRQAREAMGRSGNGDNRRDATLILPGGQEYERTGKSTSRPAP